MADETAVKIPDYVDEYLRRIERKLDSILEAIEAVTTRPGSAHITMLDQDQAHGFADLYEPIAHLHARIDLVQGELDRVDRRLTLIEERLGHADA